MSRNFVRSTSFHRGPGSSNRVFPVRLWTSPAAVPRGGAI